MDDGISTIQLCRTKLQILSQVFIQITTFQALPSKVSSFLDNSSCNSENMVSSSFSKSLLQSCSCRILSSTFDSGSGMFCRLLRRPTPWWLYARICHYWLQENTGFLAVTTSSVYTHTYCSLTYLFSKEDRRYCTLLTYYLFYLYFLREPYT